MDLERATRFLLLHGSAVLAAGLLCGLPFFRAIVGGAAPERVRGWRVAHATLIANGLFILVAGLLLPGLGLPPGLSGLLAAAMVVSGYAFVVALAGGALAGRRGLTPRPLGLETFFFVFHVLGAAGSLVGVGLVIYGALGR